MLLLLPKIKHFLFQDIHKYHFVFYYIDVVADKLPQNCCNRVFLALFTLLCYYNQLSNSWSLKNSFDLWFILRFDDSIFFLYNVMEDLNCNTWNLNEQALESGQPGFKSLIHFLLAMYCLEMILNYRTPLGHSLMMSHLKRKRPQPCHCFFLSHYHCLYRSGSKGYFYQFDKNTTNSLHFLLS